MRTLFFTAVLLAFVSPYIVTASVHDLFQIPAELLRIPGDILRIPGHFVNFLTGIPQDALNMLSSLSNNYRQVQGNSQTQIGSSGNFVDDFPDIPGRFAKSTGQFINDAATTAGHAVGNGFDIINDGMNYANAAITGIPNSVANNLGRIQSQASQFVNPLGIPIPQLQLGTATTTFNSNNPYPVNTQTGNGVTSFIVNGAYSFAGNGNINRCVVTNDGQTIVVRRNGNFVGTISADPYNSYNLVDQVAERCDINLNNGFRGTIIIPTSAVPPSFNTIADRFNRMAQPGAIASAASAIDPLRTILQPPRTNAPTINNINPIPITQTGNPNEVTSIVVNGAYSYARNGNPNRCRVTNSNQSTINVERNNKIENTLTSGPYYLADFMKESCDIDLKNFQGEIVIPTSAAPSSFNTIAGANRV